MIFGVSKKMVGRWKIPDAANLQKLLYPELLNLTNVIWRGSKELISDWWSAVRCLNLDFSDLGMGTIFNN